MVVSRNGKYSLRGMVPTAVHGSLYSPERAVHFHSADVCSQIPMGEVLREQGTSPYFSLVDVSFSPIRLHDIAIEVHSHLICIVGRCLDARIKAA